MNNPLSRRHALALLGATLTACRRSERLQIAVIPKATSHLFWLSVKGGAEAAGRELGADILWNGPADERDYSRQVQIVDSMVARRVDGIALAATERKALVAPVERARQAGVPVVVFDSGLETEQYLSYIATDNVAAGRLGGEALARLVGGKGPVAMLMHAPGSASTMDRERGFEEALRAAPGMTLVARQFGMSDRAKARAAAENILAAQSGLAGMFASSEPSSVGAALALKARGLSGKVKLVAFDSSDSLVEDMRGGTIQAMVVQDPHKMAFEAVRALVDHCRGRSPARRQDLLARVVEPSNMNDPDIRRLL